jgi:(4S)-4-hydroxy-5-phosphonooxypentane-2,3-dione isomerase
MQMYAVAVFFEAKTAHVTDLATALLRQSRTSLEREAGCHQFDVAQDPVDPAGYFLYEIYDNEAAFKRHIESAHYAAFATLVEPWVKSKKVLTFHLLEGQFGPGAGRA